MIIVIGTVLAKADTLDEISRLCMEHVRRSRAEPGCVSRDVYTSVEEPLRLFFFERWADRAAIEAHFAVPASGQFVRDVGKLADGPTSIEIYDAAPAKR
jgi:quinol monooxygenase YgiN